MATEPGLRERKKQQNRQLIFETASRLFLERGFDAVTVAEVARSADVSEVTVFNYFPTKEDLFFAGMEFFEEKLLDAVRRRGPGQPALEAFRGLVLDGAAHLAAEENAELIARAATVIGASAALQAREWVIGTHYTELLAQLLTEETGAGTRDVEPWTVASALMGVHRALVAYVRSSVLSGKRGRQLTADARAQARRGFARLESGLADYATRGDARGGDA